MPRPGRPHRPALTGRGIALGVLTVLLVVVLASPVHRYLASRSAVNDAAQQLQHDRQQLKSLQQQAARDADPGYIERQARQRLQYAMPGDTVYVVVGAGHRSTLEKTRSAAAATAPSGTSWNARLWSSVRNAGGS